MLDVPPLAYLGVISYGFYPLLEKRVLERKKSAEAAILDHLPARSTAAKPP